MKPQLTLKDFRKESLLFHRRMITILTLSFFAIILLVSRLIYLQIQQHKFYTTLSQQNQFRLIPIPPNRGLIYDRNGVLLAENIPAFSLDIIPDHVKNLKTTIEALQKIIPISDNEIQQFYKLLHEHQAYIPTPLKLTLTPQQVAKFYVNEYRFPGVTINARMIRYYPAGQSTATVVGHVGRITAKDLQHINRNNYSANNYIGKVGIEQYYEKQLHGQTGYEQVEIDASGRTVRVVKRTPPTPGENIHLTIDSQLQLEAQKVLGDENGAVVVIQPNTGQVLAMVSNPSYEPNAFVTGLTQQAFSQLTNAPGKPLYNRAIRGQYPIGSTIKPFLALEGLDSGVITTNDTIEDPGWFQLPNTQHVYHDWSAHGKVNVTKAIIVSCDTFFYNLAVAMGINQIDDILDRFGFGRHTHIDLSNELPGLVPSPAWKKNAKGSEWYTGDTINAGIGQGYVLATPLQLAIATAALAEHGLRYQPKLLLATTNNQNEQAEDPVMLQHNNIWRTVINGMEGVIFSTHPRGTGIRFGRNPAYSVAAKTGTSQVYHSPKFRNIPEDQWPKAIRNDSLFIAFAPVDKPKIAIAVVVEHSPTAPTIARKVMDYYLLTENHITKSETHAS